MLRVGILGKTDSARRKAEIVDSSDFAVLVDGVVDPRSVVEASDLVVLADGDGTTRAELAALALRRGRHVFADWPVAADAETLRLLSETAEESGVELAANRPDRLHPAVSALRHKGPTLTDVILSAGRHYRFDNLLTDAVDLCLFLSGGSGIHRYEAESAKDEHGFTALSFALRFHSGGLALGHIRKVDGAPARTIFAAGSGWNRHDDLLVIGDPSAAQAYDPSTDERAFHSCLDCLFTGKPVQTAVHELQETVRAVTNILSRTRE